MPHYRVNKYARHQWSPWGQHCCHPSPAAAERTPARRRTGPRASCLCCTPQPCTCGAMPLASMHVNEWEHLHSLGQRLGRCETAEVRASVRHFVVAGKHDSLVALPSISILQVRKAKGPKASPLPLVRPRCLSKAFGRGEPMRKRRCREDTRVRFVPLWARELCMPCHTPRIPHGSDHR